MEAFTVLDAKAAPLMRQNVNTDIIIPIHRLRDVAQADLGPYAFEPWRYLADGSENPDFFMHQPAYRGAQIVVADNNFACGSRSRRCAGPAARARRWRRCTSSSRARAIRSRRRGRRGRGLRLPPCA